MADFDEAIGVILDQEGGFINHQEDAGGATKYGISLAFLKNIGLQGDIDRDGDVDIADVRNLSIDAAKTFYKKHFWKKLGDILHQKTANYIFSMAVNAGNRRAALVVQTTINRHMKANMIHVDGVIGKKTIKSINEMQNVPLFLSLLTLHLIDFYRSIANNNRDQSVFLLGWINRAFDCLDQD